MSIIVKENTYDILLKVTHRIVGVVSTCINDIKASIMSEPLSINHKIFKPWTRVADQRRHLLWNSGLNLNCTTIHKTWKQSYKDYLITGIYCLPVNQGTTYVHIVQLQSLDTASIWAGTELSRKNCKRSCNKCTTCEDLAFWRSKGPSSIDGRLSTRNRRRKCKRTPVHKNGTIVSCHPVATART